MSATNKQFDKWHKPQVIANYDITNYNNITLSDTVTIGNHTFNANQLGQLLDILLKQHPELSI